MLGEFAVAADILVLAGRQRLERLFIKNAVRKEAQTGGLLLTDWADFDQVRDKIQNGLSWNQIKTADGQGFLMSTSDSRQEGDDDRLRPSLNGNIFGL